MARRRQGRDVHGILLLDKPAGQTSNQALQSVKRLYRARKAGHTGALDPFATGLLPVCFGEATKISALLLDADKAYQACLKLGSTTTTGDIDGDMSSVFPVPELTEAAILDAMAGLTGEIEQVPPMYSALKHRGKPLYKLARKGEVVERPPRRVTIRRLSLLDWRPDEIEFEVRCSKGTYVRTLGEVLAQALNSGGHLTQLRRIGAGPFSGADMVSPTQLQALQEKGGSLDSHLLPLDTGLQHLPAVCVDASRRERVLHGNPVVVPGPVTEGSIRVYGEDGVIIAIARAETGGLIRPARVFSGLVRGQQAR